MNVAKRLPVEAARLRQWGGFWKVHALNLTKAGVFLLVKQLQNGFVHICTLPQI